MWEANYHAIEILLQQGHGEQLLLSKNDQRSARLAHLAQANGVATVRVSRSQLSHQTKLTANFALQYRRSTQLQHLSDLTINPDSLFVLLDGITDVGNFGAILRCCDRFAVDAVIIPPRRRAKISESDLNRSSTGAALTTTIVQSNLAQAVRYFKDNQVWIYATTFAGQDLYRCQLNWPMALLFGSEDRGVSPLLCQLADQQLSINYPGSSSLNVAVASGIFLYEARRPAK